jgi:hypothetical protein
VCDGGAAGGGVMGRGWALTRSSDAVDLRRTTGELHYIPR